MTQNQMNRIEIENVGLVKGVPYGGRNTNPYYPRFLVAEIKLKTTTVNI